MVRHEGSDWTTTCCRKCSTPFSKQTVGKWTHISSIHSIACHGKDEHQLWEPDDHCKIATLIYLTQREFRKPRWAGMYVYGLASDSQIDVQKLDMVLEWVVIPAYRQSSDTDAIKQVSTVKGQTPSLQCINENYHSTSNSVTQAGERLSAHKDHKIKSHKTSKPTKICRVIFWPITGICPCLPWVHSVLLSTNMSLNLSAGRVSSCDIYNFTKWQTKNGLLLWSRPAKRGQTQVVTSLESHFNTRDLRVAFGTAGSVSQISVRSPN